MNVGGVVDPLVVAPSLAPLEVGLGETRYVELEQDALRCGVFWTWDVHAKPNQRDQCRLR